MDVAPNRKDSTMAADFPAAIPAGVDPSAYLNWLAQMQAYNQQMAVYQQQQQQAQQGAASDQQMQLFLKLIQDSQSKYQDARNANDKRSNDILAGRTDTRNRILEHWNNYGDSLIGDVNQNYDKNLKNSLAALYNTGLGQSTVNSSIRNQNETARLGELRRVKDGIIGNYAGADERLSNNIDEFQERISDEYPNTAPVDQLAGRLGGQIGGIGGIGGGPSTQSPLPPTPQQQTGFVTFGAGGSAAPGARTASTPMRTTPPAGLNPSTDARVNNNPFRPAPIVPPSAPGRTPPVAPPPGLNSPGTYSSGITHGIEPRGNVNIDYAKQHAAQLAGGGVGGMETNMFNGPSRTSPASNPFTTGLPGGMPQLPQLPKSPMVGFAAAPSSSPGVRNPFSRTAPPPAQMNVPVNPGNINPPPVAAPLPWQSHPSHQGSTQGLSPINFAQGQYQQMPALGIFGAGVQMMDGGGGYGGGQSAPAYEANGVRPGRNTNTDYLARKAVVNPDDRAASFLGGVGATPSTTPGTWGRQPARPLQAQATYPGMDVNQIMQLMKLFSVGV